MKIDDLLELVKSRRSVRRFKPDPIPNEFITKMIDVAHWAPSGANSQPWDFIIVKDPKVKDEMADAWVRCRPETYYMEQTRAEEYRANLLRQPLNNIAEFRQAPVLIVVCADRRTFQGSTVAGRYLAADGSMDASFLKSMGNATYSLHLAAKTLGLGTQWLSVFSDWEQELKKILGVPIYLQIHTVVPVGYPAYEPDIPYRRELEEFTHYDHYDMSKFRNGEQILQFLRDLRKKTRKAFDQARSK